MEDSSRKHFKKFFSILVRIETYFFFCGIFMDLLIRRIRTNEERGKNGKGKFMILKYIGEKRKQIMDDNAYKRPEIKYTARSITVIFCS